jgi:hypothetical protein
MAKQLFIVLLLLPALAQAKTPKLNITLAHGSQLEQKRKEQIERLAAEYDLEKYTITREIIIDQQAINHSAPVLTQNLRFLDDDDRALGLCSRAGALVVDGATSRRGARDAPGA